MVGGEVHGVRVMSVNTVVVHTLARGALLCATNIGGTNDEKTRWKASGMVVLDLQLKGFRYRD